jgi:hypothetical protein
MHMLDHNYVTVTPTRLCGLHTDFLLSQVVFVPEMMNYSKGEVNAKLKEWLAEPPPRVSVRDMYRKAYEIPNKQCWIFTTNSSNAIGLDPSDRRFWVPDCDGHDPKDIEYYVRLWNWLRGEIAMGVLDPDSSPFYGCEVVAAWLMKRDLSSFHAGNAPMSEAKQDMIEQALPSGVRWLQDQFDPGGGALHGRTIVGTYEVRALADDGWQSQPLRDAQIAEVLKGRGFRKLPGKHWIGGKPRNVWTTLAPELVLQAGPLADRIASDQKRKGA